MSKVLVIAEKPSAGKDIARVLGVTETKNGYMENDNYIVTWARGHLIGLKDPEENDERYKTWKVEDIPLPYDNGLKVKQGTYDQFKVIKGLIQRSDVSYLINAGDAGREGLLIQSWIYRMCGNKHPVKMLWASSLTDEAIRTAMGRLHDEKEEEFINLLREAETRAIADQVYGYNYTRALTCLYSVPGTVLSYGRCQTPLLNLIVKRDKEIENFKSVPFWIMTAGFQNNISFTADEVDENGDIKRYFVKEAAKEALDSCGRQAQVKECKKEEKQNKAPALFNLAEIQSTMGKKYGLKPDETLEIAQKLYETYKIMSYPRTDSRYLSTDLYGEIESHLKSCSFGKFKELIDPINFTDITMDKAYFNNNKVSDHHALIPTINAEIENIYNNQLSEMEKNFFDEIVAGLIAVFYPAYRYESTELLITLSGRNFKTSGTVTKEEGYKKVYSVLKTAASKKDVEQQPLPVLKEGQLLPVESLELKEGKTKPPAPYNPGNITKLMNKYKIGTSATSAGIIQTLEKRKFIVLNEKKKYRSTELGRELINCIPDILKSEKMTIDFENKLTKVNSGEISKEEFLEDIIEQIRVNMEVLKNDSEGKTLVKESHGMKCPICGCDIRAGKTKTGKEYVYCTGYKNEPSCNFKIWREIAGKKISDTNIDELLSKGKTSLIKGFQSSKTGNSFSAYLKLNKNGEIEFEFKKKK